MRDAIRSLTRAPAVRFVVKVVNGFIDHDDMSMAAAVAFYTVLSFAPLVLLMMTLGALVGGGAESDLVQFFERQIGPRAGEVTEAIVESAKDGTHQTNKLRSAISVILLVLSASGVFGQLQTSLNHIWELDRTPRTGVWNWIRKRLLSLGMVLAALFILLVSLVLSSAIDQILPAGEGAVGRIGLFITSFVVAGSLFAAIFRVLPDRDIAWRQVWLGAVITAALFSGGKFVVAAYIGRSGVTDSYGKAAGALLALLLWVYYSCIITFIGAEITRQVAGPRPPPTRV
jgi:membrane protein